MLQRALAALAVLLSITPSVKAGEWLYPGTALPRESGWQLYGTSSYENGGGITSTVVEGSWKLADSSTANRCLLRNTSLGNISFDVGATLVARAKCESASANSSYILGISNGNVGGMFLKLTTTQLYLVDLDGYYRGSCAIDSTVSRNYHLTVKTASAGNPSTAVWRVYVDGAEVITWTGAGEHAGYDGFMAGHGGLSGTGVWCFDAIAARNDGAYTPAQWDPIPADPPDQPTVVVPANGAVVGTSGVLVQWAAGPHDRYEVHINSTNSPSDAGAWDSGEVRSPDNACTSGPVAAGTYYVFVRVGNSGGWSPWSPAGMSFTVASEPLPPQAPTVIVPGPDGVTRDSTPTVQWAGDAHDFYEIHITRTESPTDDVAWDSGFVNSSADRHDAGPLPPGDYYTFVRLHSQGGWSPWSTKIRRFQVNPSAQEMKQGWVLLRDEPITYFEELLSHAPEYHVNMVHISHSIMMYVWEPLNYPERRAKINQIAALAHDNGVDEVVAWVHDIQDCGERPVPSQYKTPDGKVNLDLESFWTWLEGTYLAFFDACPQVDGIVLTLTENFVCGGVDVWDRTGTRHTGKTPEDSCLKLIQTIWGACQQRGKSLYVRNWTLYGGADRWIRNAIIRTGEPDIWMMSKATGAGDWDVIQEPYDIIGTCTGHPELVEFDVTGEYWGYTWTPWSGVDYIRHLWTDFALPRGAKGMVARIDRDDNGQAPGIHPRAMETPNRINLYALDVFANYPNVPSDDIYDYFCTHWFGRAASARAASALKRSFDISNACYDLPKPNTSPNYSFSDSVAKDYCLASLFDIDCANASLRAASNFSPDLSNYDALRDPFERAASKLNLAIPRTLFGDFTCTTGPGGNASCSVWLVDAGVGFNPSTLSVKYSSNSGATWTTYANPVITATGSARDPYRVFLSNVPFSSLGAGKNRVRFEVTYPGGTQDAREFTVKGLDQAWVSLGSAITGDGMAHPQPQGGDGDTTEANAGGRSCRRSASSGDTTFYLHVDDGFRFGAPHSTMYLQVDYYGSGGSITPIYDSRLRTDETLTPVYLNGSGEWRTATWRLDDVNFGNRLTDGADIRLYVGTGMNVYISGVRLYENPPAGMLDQPRGLTASAASPTQVALSWEPVPGATRYQVCRGAACVGWATGTTFTDAGLSPNTQYSYTVTAYGNSGFTSAASFARVVTTLPSAPSVTPSRGPAQWSTSAQLTLTLNGSFGWGGTGYCRYAFDESPTHSWTGTEATWPAGIEPTPGWTAWKPTMLPTEPGSGWLLYDGSTTQRCMSEALVPEAEGMAWRLTDQGRVVNTKTKLANWPILPVNRSIGVTMAVRMKASDSPLGWADSGPNFGLNLLDSAEAGVSVRPDYLRLSVPGGDVAVSAPENGYSYHTYTLTLRGSTYTLYRDGRQVLTRDATSYPESMWSGPFFGHSTSNGVGAWSFLWIAWTNGCFPPAAWDSPLTLTAPRPGSSYYVHLMSFNADGVPNGSVDLGPFYYWDGSTPAAPTVTDDGAYTTSTAIHATYTPAAPSITSYQYAIGTSAGAHDVLSYTTNGQSLEITRTGLSLVEDQVYFVSVRGVTGVTGPAGSSDGIRVAPRRERIAQAKALPDGAPVALYGKTVSAVFNNCFYVQEAGTSAIKVITSRPVTVGDVVDVAGVMGGAGSERFIKADAVFVTQ